MNVIDQYARDVVGGRIPAGKYHLAACRRHLHDRQREATPAFPYRFDMERAERFFRFCAQLRHYKGEFAGQPLIFQPWQQFILGSLFGWVHVATGIRRFRTTYFEIPRKNGKSTTAAPVALYLTFFDGEPGAEGYTIATKRDQAKIVFNDAKQMVEATPDLKKRLGVRVANIHKSDTACKLEPLGADHDSTDGLNPHLIVIDEFHAHKDRGLIDVMETATGARRQPVIFGITTAGNDPVSPCGDQHDYACKILDGVLDDDSFLAFIAHADEGDPWDAEETWRKANPNYGISVNPDDLKAKALKARNMSSAAATFQQKHCNIWVNADTPWLSMDGWKAGQTARTRVGFMESLRGRRCFAAVDLSSKIDLTAVALMFPPVEGKVWALHAECFTPADTLEERAHRDRAPYQVWRDQGWLTTTPGNRIDYDMIRDRLKELRTMFDIQQVGFDPWNAGNLEQHLTADGFTVVEIPQTINHMSAPSKDFEADVLDGLVDSGSNPLLAWCVSNVVVQRDGKDNIYPTKKKSRGRIDPIIAAIMARKLAGVDVVQPDAVQFEWV